MHNIYTIEELALCRDDTDIVRECGFRIESGDIVIGKNSNSSLDLILDSLGPEFKREIAYHIINSNNPSHAKTKAGIVEKIERDALSIASQLEKPF